MLKKKKTVTPLERYTENYNLLMRWLHDNAIEGVKAQNKSREYEHFTTPAVRYMLGEDIFDIIPEANDPEQLKKVLNYVPDLSVGIFNTTALLAQVAAILNYKNEMMTRLFGDKWLASAEYHRVKDRMASIPNSVGSSTEFIEAQSTIDKITS